MRIRKKLGCDPGVHIGVIHEKKTEAEKKSKNLRISILYIQCTISEVTSHHSSTAVTPDGPVDTRTMILRKGLFCS
jgi:hypothetical protein